jgi:hypothetical protein
MSAEPTTVEDRMPLRTLLLTASLTFVTASAAVAGPPWISVELPANPHHPSTRGAAFMIRAYHHSTSISVPVAGRAHGIVDGRRVTMPLDIRPTNQTGVFAVHTELPRNGAWVLAVTLTESADATATALVSVDGRGRIVAVDVPIDRPRDGWNVPRSVTDSDIESALRAISVTAAPTAGNAHAALLTLPVLLLGGLLARRRSRR